jgi:hypothetical protein
VGTIRSPSWIKANAVCHFLHFRDGFPRREAAEFRRLKGDETEMSIYFSEKRNQC